MNRLLRLKASVGGYFGGYISVVVDLEQSNYTYSHSLSDNEIINDIDEDEKEYIAKMIDKLNLKNWKESYANNDIMDGTQWDVELIFNDESKSMYGSNDYPKEWESFSKVISRITQQEFK